MIKCENVSIKYGSFTAVKDVSFFVEKGDFVTVLGENGCGKSSLIKAVLGLCSVSGGKISVDAAGGIGYVPQLMPVQENFPASAMEIVLSGFVKKAGLFYSAEQKRQATDVLKKLEIENAKKLCFREMSGGQRQRVLLARALCAGDKLLVLDEPVASLDEEISKTFYGILSEQNRQGTTVLMISHDSENALKYSNKILCFKNGDYFFGETKSFVKWRENL